MNTGRALALALSVTVAVSVAAVWLVPPIQDFMVGNTVWNGLRDLVADTKARSIESLGALPADPSQTTLVSIPYLKYSPDDLKALESFLLKGGTLLLLDDYGFGNQVLEYLGVEARFDGSPLLDPLFAVRRQWLPKIVDFSPSFQAAHPEIGTVALNHATALSNVAPEQVIARSSPTSFLDTDGDESPGPEELPTAHPVAAVMPWLAGNLVLVSDPSLLINSMLGREDNRAFARALTRVGGGERLVITDVSHLTSTPLDVSKAGLASLREILSGPFALLGMVVAALAAFTFITLRTGGRFERHAENS